MCPSSPLIPCCVFDSFLVASCHGKGWSRSPRSAVITPPSCCSLYLFAEQAHITSSPVLQRGGFHLAPVHSFNSSVREQTFQFLYELLCELHTRCTTAPTGAAVTLLLLHNHFNMITTAHTQNCCISLSWAIYVNPVNYSIVSFR